MPEAKRCPIPTRGGGDCWESPHPDSRYGICARHWAKVLEEYRPSHDLVHVRCPKCGQFGLRTVPIDNVAYCDNRDCATVIYDFIPDLPPGVSVRGRMAAAIELKELPPKRRPPVVYYLRFGDRVKIGTTTNLAARAKQIYHDEIMAAEPGGPSVEARRHTQFAEYLVAGQREWFTLAPALAFHINTIRDQHGDPVAVGMKRAA